MPKLKSREYQDMRANWLEERRGGIGASDAAVILGLNPYKSPLALWTEKMGLAPATESNERMDWGHRLEAPIAEAYEEETHRLVIDPGDFTIYRHSALRFIMATLDRVVRVAETSPTGDPPDIIASPAPAEGLGVLEIKTTSAFKKDDWADEPPLLYQIQVQHQLAVTGYHWGSLAVLIGGQEFLWQDVQRNEDFITHLLTAEETFWRSVVDQQPPPADESDSSAEALKLMYPRQLQDTIPLPASLLEWDAQRLRADAMEEEARRLKVGANNKIKAVMGDHAYGIFPNGIRYSWLEGQKAGYTVAPTTTRTLRRTAPKGLK